MHNQNKQNRIQHSQQNNTLKETTQKIVIKNKNHQNTLNIKQSKNKIIKQLCSISKDNSETLSNCSSNASFIQQLENVNIQQDVHATQDCQMIKICDGVYVGGQNCIWDTETMSLNYITHLIVILLSQEQQKTADKGQKYVPETIQFIHCINYDFSPQAQNTIIFQKFSKIVQFVQHAHQLGQSCVFIYKQQLGKDNSKNKYKLATIVCGYLMYRYAWSTLKSAQFITSRFNASFFTTQTLHKANHNKISNEHHNCATQYSKGLMTHLIPELSNPSISNLTQFSTNLVIFLPTLYLLQNSLVSQRKFLSYGWQKNQLAFVKSNLQQSERQQQIVLTNTFLNCIMGSQLNLNYINLLSSSSSYNLMFPSLKRERKKISNPDQEHKKSMKLLSVNKKQIKIKNIIIKHTRSVDKIIKEQSKEDEVIKINQTNSGCLRSNNLKIRNKRVIWKQKLIDQLENQTIYKQISRSKTEQSLHDILNKQNNNICAFPNNNTLNLKKQAISAQSVNIKNNKIKINVIDIVASRNKQTDRNNGIKNSSNALTRRKSKAKLPTLLDQIHQKSSCEQLQQPKKIQGQNYKNHSCIKEQQEQKKNQQSDNKLKLIKQKNRHDIFIEIDAIYSENSNTVSQRSQKPSIMYQKQNKNINNLQDPTFISDPLRIILSSKQKNKENLIHATLEQLKKISLKPKVKTSRQNQRI